MTVTNAENYRTRRFEAAELIRRYLDDEITGGEVAERWPICTEDRALTGISDEILPELRGGKLIKEHKEKNLKELRQILERCRLFLSTKLPYAWGKLGTGSCLSFGCLTVVLVFLSGTVIAVLVNGLIGGILILTPLAGAVISIPASGVTSKADPSKIQSMVKGNLKYWPFEFEGDFQAVKEGIDPFEAAEAHTPGLDDF